MPNGRCRLHGRLSTGPKTAEGKKRAREAVLKHGLYAKEFIDAQKQLDFMLHGYKEYLKDIKKVT